MYVKDGDRRRKIITRELLDNMSDLGLCLMFLDDGYFQVRYYENSSRIREAKIRLALCSFSIEE